MRIIPAIDIIDGKCVRLTQGDYEQKKIYNENPLEVAKEFQDAGIQYLHVVDLDGAKAKSIVNWKTLETLANQTQLTIDFGGGIKKEEDLKVAFNSGAAQVTVGSAAAQDPESFFSWLKAYGANKIILGADAKNEKIAINGWQESTSKDLTEFLNDNHKQGAIYSVITDISKDGMLEGPATDLYARLMKEFPEMKLIASGGIAGIEDLQPLKDIGMDGVIIGKAIYENRISLKELEEFAL